MGARGNSGVITSQILRGLCEGSAGAEAVDAASIDAAFAQAVDVAFQAVRKPVEGTILTVLRDSRRRRPSARARRSFRDRGGARGRGGRGLRLGAAHAGPAARAEGERRGGRGRLRAGHLLRRVRGGPDGQGGASGRRAGLRARRRPQGGDRADQRLGRLGVPLLHRVPGAFRRAGRGRRQGVPAHHGRLRPSGGHAPQLQGARALEPPRPGAWRGSWATRRRCRRCTSTTCSCRARRAPTRWPPSRRAERKPLGLRGGGGRRGQRAASSRAWGWTWWCRAGRP